MLGLKDGSVVKDDSCQPGDLNLIVRTHEVKGENRLSEVAL